MSLQAAEGDPRHMAVERLCQMNRRAAHATTDIEDGRSRWYVGRRGKFFGQLQLSAGGRLRGVPQTVMNVPPPQQTIEQRRQVVMVANNGLPNVRAIDHDGLFQSGEAAGGM